LNKNIIKNKKSIKEILLKKISYKNKNRIKDILNKNKIKE